MTIECAILGLLSREPLAGYDLKKRMQDDPVMPWSGNNNQIYKALSAMLDEGLVVSEHDHRDGLPSRKVYTITEDGRAHLARWLAEPPELTDQKKPFLAQLSLADSLGPCRVDALLETYARQLLGQLEQCSKPTAANGFAATLQALVRENLRMSYQTELDWTNRAREAIQGDVVNERSLTQVAVHQKENATMQYEVIERNGATYLYYAAQTTRPASMDPTQIVGDCIGERANRVLIDASALPEAFFSLRTGVAGEVMQKLGQYRVKAALLLSDKDIKGKFLDMLIETNRGVAFRSFQDGERAVLWLMEA